MTAISQLQAEGWATNSAQISRLPIPAGRPRADSVKSCGHCTRLGTTYTWIDPMGSGQPWLGLLYRHHNGGGRRMMGPDPNAKVAGRSERLCR